MATCVNGHEDPPRYANGNCKLCQYARNKEIRNDMWKRRNASLRKQALDAYGGKCVCCGEDREPFLVLDHIEDNGAEHRREIAGGKARSGAGYLTYKWVKDAQYPEGFQVLCANCNMAKVRGVCPHEAERSS